jgi:molybdenum cofactor cytidylyltransferase
LELDVPGIGAIVLAAGGSTRMGRPKQLLQYKGESFLRRAVNSAAQSNCHPVIVVLGSNADELAIELAGLSVDLAINDNWQRGIGSSIRTGMQRLIALAATLDATLLLLCDQPLIDGKAIARLIEFYKKSAKPVCVSSFGSAFGPPIVVGKDFFQNLLSLPDDRGAKELWLNHPEVLSIFNCAEAGTDIDIPADFARLL